MPKITPCSESSRTQKFIYRMAFELGKLAQEFGRSQGGSIRPPPPTECVTSQTPMGRGLKHHCIPILPHACPHIAPGSVVRWGSSHVFLKSVFLELLGTVYIECHTGIKYQNTYIYYTVRTPNLVNFSFFGMHIGVMLNIPILSRHPLRFHILHPSLLSFLLHFYLV